MKQQNLENKNGNKNYVKRQTKEIDDLGTAKKEKSLERNEISFDSSTK